MKCSHCNNEMTKGFIQCRDGVYWTPKQQWSPVFSSMAEGAIPLGADDKFMPNSKALAYNCSNCRTVIIPYGEDNKE